MQRILAVSHVASGPCSTKLVAPAGCSPSSTTKSAFLTSLQQHKPLCASNTRVGRHLRAKQRHSTVHVRATGVEGSGGDQGQQQQQQNQQDGRSFRERLFSNLNPFTLKHEPGSVVGAASLVAGTTVGAGILALPAVTAPSGFVASSAALLACWAYSVITGLLVAEVSLNTMCEIGGRGTSVNSMARRTLGRAGQAASTATFVLLQYTLLVAYTAKGGEVVANRLQLPGGAASAAFAGAMVALCYAAPPRVLDAANTLLVLAVVASFGGLLALAAGDVVPGALLRAEWDQLPAALPVMALAFVYQNVVPSVVSSLEGDVVKVRTAVVAGSSIPLVMFLAWDAVILGNPDVLAAAQAGTSFDPLAVLRGGGGSSALLGPLVDAFTFFAIATSFIGFVISLADFFADVLQLPVGSRQASPFLLAVGPPVALSLTVPASFFVPLLDFAGTYGVLVLFGLLPPAMAYSERYMRTTLTQYQVVPGGQLLLWVVGALAASIIGNQLLQTVGGMAGGGA